MSERRHGRDPADPTKTAEPATPEPTPAPTPPVGLQGGGNAAIARRIQAGRAGDATLGPALARTPTGATAGAVLARDPTKTGAPPKDPEPMIGPLIWSWNLTPRARSVEAIEIEREFSRDTQGVAYKDDTMWVDVQIRGITPENQADYAPTMITINSVDVDGDADPVFTGRGFRWNLHFSTMGHVGLGVTVDGPEGPESWDRSLMVYGDLIDYKNALDRTSDLVNADILDAGAQVDDAAAAYKAAYEHQKAILDHEAKNRQMVEDLLWTALFAGLGGLAGGAVGTGMGRLLGKELKDTLAGGAAIDAAKDVTKSLTRGVLAMGRPGASVEELKLKPISTDPFTFLTQWSASAKREGSFLLRQIAAVKKIASAAQNENSIALFDEDPYSALEKDPGLTFLKEPMSNDPKVYTRSLWEQWLGAYGYEFIDEHFEYHDDGGSVQPAIVSDGVGRGSKFEDAIMEALVASGMSEGEARAWYEEARRPAKERAQAQLAQRRAGQTPDEYTPGKPASPTGRPDGAPGAPGR